MLDSPFGIQRSEIESLVLLIYVPKVPDFLYIFGTKLKKREKIYENVQK